MWARAESRPSTQLLDIVTGLLGSVPQAETRRDHDWRFDAWYRRSGSSGFARGGIDTPLQRSCIFGRKYGVKPGSQEGFMAAPCLTPVIETVSAGDDHSLNVCGCIPREDHTANIRAFAVSASDTRLWRILASDLHDEARDIPWMGLEPRIPCRTCVVPLKLANSWEVQELLNISFLGDPVLVRPDEERVDVFPHVHGVIV